MALTVQNGSLVVRDGKLGTEQGCCCGGGVVLPCCTLYFETVLCNCDGNHYPSALRRVPLEASCPEGCLPEGPGDVHAPYSFASCTTTAATAKDCQALAEMFMEQGYSNVTYTWTQQGGTACYVDDLALDQRNYYPPYYVPPPGFFGAPEGVYNSYCANCGTDADCPAGQYCCFGGCTPYPCYCAGDGDCGEGYYCCVYDGYCLPILDVQCPVLCDGDVDCPEGEFCCEFDGVKVCADAQTCSFAAPP